MSIDKLKPVDANKKISYSIIEALVEMLKEGMLNVGDKLPPERELTAQFGVSRASLREALSALSIIGVIEVRQGGGSYISDFNLSVFLNVIAPLFVRNDQMEKDLLDFRRLLELEALRLIIEKGNRDTANLRAELAIMREAMLKNNVASNVQADIAFHKELFIMSDNYVLMQVSGCVQFLLEKSVRFNVSKILERGDNARVLYKHHNDLCEYIERGLGEKAENLLKEHLDFVKKV